MPLTYNSLLTPQKPAALTAVATTANTNYTDTPTNMVEFLPANGNTIAVEYPNGLRLSSLKALARATPTATELQLFVSDAAGAVKRFISSTLMAAYTVAQTTGQTEVDFTYGASAISDSNPLILAAGERLWFAIGVTNTGIVARAEGGAY